MTSLLDDIHPAIDEASIKKLVDVFYGRARADALIGPVFNENVTDWDDHLEKITQFWSSIILKTGSYHGRPLPPHLRLMPGTDLFERWLDLFEKTALEIWPMDAANMFIDRARRIADSFEMAISTHKGEIKAPRHYRRPPPQLPQ